MKQHFGCPVQATANLMAGKWKVLILWHLSFRPRRFSDLKRLLPGVSEKVLTGQLRELARDGVITRISNQAVPPQVTYRLAEAGNELIPVMEAMCAWGTRYLGIQPNLPRTAAAGGSEAAS